MSQRGRTQANDNDDDDSAATKKEVYPLSLGVLLQVGTSFLCSTCGNSYCARAPALSNPEHDSAMRGLYVRNDGMAPRSHNFSR